jgi:hypothetical protein
LITFNQFKLLFIYLQSYCLDLKKLILKLFLTLTESL